jgi:hypothetical protein
LIGWIADTQSNGTRARRHRHDKLFWAIRQESANGNCFAADESRRQIIISDKSIMMADIIRLSKLSFAETRLRAGRKS